MDGFQRRREWKKKNILEATFQLFLKYGIKKVSIAEIAEKANVSQVTIYNYFDSKDNLIQQAVINYIEKSYQEYQDILDSNISFSEKIEKIIFNQKDIAQHIHEEVYDYIMTDFKDGSSYLEKMYQEKSIPFFQQLINEGKEKGFIYPDLSEEAIMFYIQMLKDYTQKKEVAKYLLPLTEDILNIFFYGIIGKRK
ncbi:TetR/AcrR family transcriptional regulator [Gracilibacillus sp. YIM 98692]|uniref:TetR/AcrR family transcriptional regulator n=1 Tax=Gracilibacillus sp. YIM 98692 TaxID=2663532 RepID=UPI0013D76C3F|nr:TetR/AcrR family transcriptional regulator [Gracilibacillus sp. YIM 98692]